MGLEILKPVSRRFSGKTMSHARGVSPLTPASPNPHMQNKVAAKGPVQLWRCYAEGMLNFWGKEAGQKLGGTARGHRDVSKAGSPSKGEMLADGTHRTSLSSKYGWFPTATHSFCNGVKLPVTSAQG